MRLTLGIDTSTVVCAGLARDGEVLASLRVEDRRAHAEQLSPLIERVLAEAGVTATQLDAVCVGLGPGPFTGLRVGVVSAAVLADVRGIPLRGVCSLDIIALDWVGRGAPNEFVVAADARRKEVYWARYAADGTRLDGPFVTRPDVVPELPLGGPGAALCPRPDLIAAGAPRTVDAGLMAAWADRLPDEGTEPLYLRRPDAEVPGARKSTLLQPRLARMKR